MLNNVSIKNFAIVKESNFSFDNGFNVIVGETGAGKTIVLSAILFALGFKSDKTLIRTGEQSCRVELAFSDINKTAIEFLNENGIDYEDNSVVISRTLDIEGKSNCRINGCMITATNLKNFSCLMVDCYQQHESTEILKVKNHINMLDNYNPIELSDIKNEITKLLNNQNEIDKELKAIGGSKEERERTLDLLDYQIKEITSANLYQGEDEELAEKIFILNNSEKLKENYETILSSLGDNGAISFIKTANTSFHNIERLSSEFENLSQRVESVKYEIEDITETIQNKYRSMLFDDRELENLLERQDKIKLLKKKYGNTFESIMDYLEKSKTDKYNLENAEERIGQLEISHKKICSQLYNLCNKLTQFRKSIAVEIETKIINELSQLGMKNARFKVNISSIKNSEENFSCTPNGNDNVEFLFSANSGEDIKSLAKTISGGEMSRFMLAIKNVLADKFGVSTLILDEVDSGISGNIGGKVAEKIASLSKSFQIICITHLPQVCAMADNYYLVSKQQIDNKTFSNVKTLNEREQIEYIAKLSSANSVTESSIAHAKELKDWANNYKNN